VLAQSAASHAVGEDGRLAQSGRFREEGTEGRLAESGPFRDVGIEGRSHNPPFPVEKGKGGALSFEIKEMDRDVR
jgi:hypothetical protein